MTLVVWFGSLLGSIDLSRPAVSVSGDAASAVAVAFADVSWVWAGVVAGMVVTRIIRFVAAVSVSVVLVRLLCCLRKLSLVLGPANPLQASATQQPGPGPVL